MKLSNLIELTTNEAATGNMFYGLKDEAQRQRMLTHLNNCSALVGGSDIDIIDEDQLNALLTGLVGDDFTTDEIDEQNELVLQVVGIANRYAEASVTL